VARSRNIKPGIYHNEVLVTLPFETRYMFAGLACFADREGRLEDKPSKIKMQMFPCDHVDVNAMLNQLSECGFIERYTVDHHQYIQIVNFKKHQNPHKAEQESEIPAPCKHGANTVQVHDLHGSNRADSLNPLTDSLNPSKSDAPRKRGCRIPEGWEPSDELKAWTLTERPGIGLQQTIENFTDYWKAKTGQSATKLDWDATWRNWIRNANGNATQHRTGKTTVQQRDERNRAAYENAEQYVRDGRDHVI